MNMNVNSENNENFKNSKQELNIDILTGEVLEKGNIDSVIDFVNSAESVLDEMTFNTAKQEATGTSEAENTSENNTENTAEPKKLFFLPRKWKFNPECQKNKGERTIITDMFGKLSEAFCIGNWGWDWTEIQSEMLVLEKNTDYVFTFWLNGGENDRYQETCQLEIIFDNDKDNSFTYKLNRDIIKPVKRYKGWVLFEIPFKTETNDYTRLKFAVMNAHTAILPALGKEAYANLPDDVIDPRVPQRHNIVFRDGFPRDSKWSYLIFGEEINDSDNRSHGNDTHHQNIHFHGMDDFEDMGSRFQKMGDMINDKVNAAMGFADNIAGKAQSFKSNIGKEIYENIIDEIEDEIREEVTGSLKGEIKDNIKTQVIDEILKQFRTKKD